MGSSTNLARAGAPSGSPRLRGLKRPGIDSRLVLVVDDDPFNLMVAAQRLSFMGSSRSWRPVGPRRWPWRANSIWISS